MENEQNHRAETMALQYDLGQKQLNALMIIRNQTSRKLSSLETDGNQVSFLPISYRSHRLLYLDQTKYRIHKKSNCSRFVFVETSPFSN